MNAMVKIDMIRQIVDAVPLEGCIGFITGADGGQHRAVIPDLRVAGHTGFGRWNTGIGGVFNGDMAVAAVNPQSADMMLMAEGHRLPDGNINLGHIGRTDVPSF